MYPAIGLGAFQTCRTKRERSDFSGKVVHPVTTRAMSGLGATEHDYAVLCPSATIGEGLAVQGETVSRAGPTVEAWLHWTGLIARREG